MPARDWPEGSKRPVVKFRAEFPRTGVGRNKMVACFEFEVGVEISPNVLHLVLFVSNFSVCMSRLLLSPLAVSEDRGFTWTPENIDPKLPQRDAWIGDKWREDMVLGYIPQVCHKPGATTACVLLALHDLCST